MSCYDESAKCIGPSVQGSNYKLLLIDREDVALPHVKAAGDSFNYGSHPSVNVGAVFLV